MFVDGLPFQKDGSDKEEIPDEIAPIRIGIIGQDPFQDAFDIIVKRQIKNHRIVVMHFKGLYDPNGSEEPVTIHPQIKQIEECDLLFLCPSEQPYADVLLKPLRTRNILTVADRQAFMDNGVIINFTTEQSRIRFDINLIAARKAELTIRSKLLRVARKIIE